MSFTILGQGTAVPEHSIDRKQSVDLVLEHLAHTDRDRRLVPVLYRMAGVRKRHSVLLTGPGSLAPEARISLFYSPTSPEDLGPPIGLRMEAYEQHALPLALESSEAALKDGLVERDQITHLITVSCSGFYAPGVEVELMQGLGLNPRVQRTHIGFMGCSAALNGLRVAQGFCSGSARATVLLCAVEICSIHYHYGWEPDKVVANALFADGSAAVVGTNKSPRSTWRIAATGSCLIPDSASAMTWRIGDRGFEMSLSPAVPGLIEGSLRDWLEEWLSAQGLELGEIGSWAVHPGGPRVLASVGKALGLAPEQLQTSHDVFAEYGNMSSPTVLFILQRLRAENAPRPCVALGFGPGLVAEATLFV
jgi:prepilin-type processing-associated H-X9-DG protein